MGVVVPLRSERGAGARPAEESAAEERAAEDFTAEEPTDAALVRAALGGVHQGLQGAQKAKEQLYRRHVRMVTGLAHRVMPSDPEIEDLVQDAFVAAFEGLGRLSNPQAFASFVASITVRGARRRIRRRRMRRRLGLVRGEPADADRVVSASAPPDVGAELRALYRLLETLPEDVRIALVLRRVEGLTIPAIAHMMNLSPATVKRRISDGEVLLGAELERSG